MPELMERRLNNLIEHPYIEPSVGKIIEAQPDFSLFTDLEDAEQEIENYIDKEISFEEVDKSYWVQEEGVEVGFDSTTLDDIIVYFFSKVNEVKEIYRIKESETKYHVWSVIPQKISDVKKRIYQQERVLMKFFREDIFFDFHIIEISDREYLKDEKTILIFER